MTEREDIRLVEALYGESKKDEKVDEAELESYAKMLSMFRAVEDEEPSPHLDALILAHARQVADETREASLDKGLRGFLRKALRSPLAGVAVVTSLVVIVAVPALILMQSSERAAMEPMTAAKAPEAQPVVAQPPRPEPELANEPMKEARIAPAEAARADEDREGAADEKRRDEPVSRTRGTVSHSRVRAQRTPLRAAKADSATKGGDVADRLTGLPRDESEAKKPAPPPAEAKAAEKAEAPKKKAAVAFDDTIASDGAKASGERERRQITQNERLAQKDSRTHGQEEPASNAGPAPSSPAATAEAEAQAPAAGGYGASEGFARKAEPPPSAPVTVAAPSDKTSDLGAASSSAGDMIRAAEQQLKGGDPQGARNVLFTALARTQGTPAAGDVELELGRLELGQKRYSEAIAHGRAAYGTRGFRKRLEALNVVHQAAVASGSKSDLAWEENERVRAVKAVR